MKKGFKLKHFEKIVSVFLFLAIFFVATMVIFLAKQKKLFAKKNEYYTTINSIEKISTGQEVILKGPNIPIGKISNFSITEDNRVRVDFFIYKEYEDKIRTDSVVIFTSPLFGLLGGYKVEMTTGNKYYPKVKSTALIPSNQMQEGVYLLSFQKSIKKEAELPLISKIDPLLENLTTILNPKGRFIRNINELIRNLSIFALQLSEGGLLNVLGDPSFRSSLRKMVVQLNYLLNSSTNLMNSKVSNILSEVYLLLSNLKKTTETVNFNMPKILGRLNSAIFRLERMMENLSSSPLLGGGYKKKDRRGTKRYFEGH